MGSQSSKELGQGQVGALTACVSLTSGSKARIVPLADTALSSQCPTAESLLELSVPQPTQIAGLPQLTTSASFVRASQELPHSLALPVVEDSLDAPGAWCMTATEAEGMVALSETMVPTRMAVSDLISALSLVAAQGQPVVPEETFEGQERGPTFSPVVNFATEMEPRLSERSKRDQFSNMSHLTCRFSEAGRGIDSEEQVPPRTSAISELVISCPPQSGNNVMSKARLAVKENNQGITCIRTATNMVATTSAVSTAGTSSMSESTTTGSGANSSGNSSRQGSESKGNRAGDSAASGQYTCGGVTSDESEAVTDRTRAVSSSISSAFPGMSISQAMVPFDLSCKDTATSCSERTVKVWDATSMRTTAHCTTSMFVCSDSRSFRDPETTSPLASNPENIDQNEEPPSWLQRTFSRKKCPSLRLDGEAFVQDVAHEHPDHSRSFVSRTPSCKRKDAPVLSCERGGVQLWDATNLRRT